MLNNYGFTHNFQVDVHGQTIIFEPDEDSNYRAVINYEGIDKAKEIDNELIKAINNSIEAIAK